MYVMFTAFTKHQFTGYDAVIFLCSLTFKSGTIVTLALSSCLQVGTTLAHSTWIPRDALSLPVFINIFAFSLLAIHTFDSGCDIIICSTCFHLYA